MRNTLTIIFLCLLLPLKALGLEFAIRANGELHNNKISPIFVLPDETVHFESAVADQQQVKCSSDYGRFTEVKRSACSWLAPPTPGKYTVEIRDQKSVDRKISFQAFVLVPYERLNGEFLNSYRVGTYPSHDDWAQRVDKYELPKGFIEVTRENEEVNLTPHFALKQFTCKQESSYPKYIALDERLLFKLEAILSELNRSGYNLSTLTVMSGYRTPHYNQAIENVKLSRHIFGQAADIYIPHDSHDEYKRIGLKEIGFLYKLVDSLELRPSFRSLIGGMGSYALTSAHPAFLHVDVRGRKARW